LSYLLKDGAPAEISQNIMLVAFQLKKRGLANVSKDILSDLWWAFGYGGSGQTFTPCGTCGGDGRVRRSKRISLRVPPGVDGGSRLRVRGEGNAGRRGGPAGDLYVFVNVREDPDLKRFESVNISSTVTIPYTQAILGSTQKVRTVDGFVDLKIPAGVQPGATLLMAKRGVPRLGRAPRTRDP